MSWKRILLTSILFVFVGIINMYAYQLPNEADMLKFLPDKVGAWVADSSYNDFIDDLDEYMDAEDNNDRYVNREYKNGKKYINVSIGARLISPEEYMDEDFSEYEDFEDEIKCDVKSENLKIQGFNAIATTAVCEDGIKSNILEISFIDDDNFYYEVMLGSSSFEDIAGLGDFNDEFFGEQASMDEIMDFANKLNLKGIRALIK